MIVFALLLSLGQLRQMISLKSLAYRDDCSNKHKKLRHIHIRHGLERIDCLIKLSILVLLFTDFKSLASLKRSLVLGLALLAFKTENQLLGLLGLQMRRIIKTHLLVENRLGLTTETLLLSIVSSLTYPLSQIPTFYPEVSKKPYQPCIE